MRKGFIALAVLAAGCSSDPDFSTASSSSSSGSSSSSSSTSSGMPMDAPRCDAHAVTGSAHFTDRSSDWGLTSQPVGGTWQVLSAADLDGDGYPDLLVHSVGGDNEREAVGAKVHLTRVFMNVPRMGGGRTFVDKTLESGYLATRDGSKTDLRHTSMAVFADVDNDGDLDVMSGTYTNPNALKSPLSPGDLDRSEVMLNDGKGHFSLVTGSNVPTKGASYLAGATFVDADRDGFIDVFVTNWFGANYAFSPQQLLRGGPGAVFTDVSTKSGIRNGKHYAPAFGATACDLDGDGAPELLANSYGRRPNQLYRLDGPLHYAEVGKESGYAFDADQKFEDDETFKCYCSLNASAQGCQGIKPPQIQCNASVAAQWVPGQSDLPENLGGNNFTTVCADLNGDGKMDLYTSEIKHWWAGESSDPSELLVNESDASGIKFKRPGRPASGLDWKHKGTVNWDEGGLYANAGDLDNDGRNDLVVGASDYGDQWGLLYHQKDNGLFEEVAKASGFVHACANAPLLVDFDRDGDLDIVLGSSVMRDFCAAQYPNGPELAFFENDASKSGGYLAIRLQGDGMTANRAAIGARVRVKTIAEDGTETVQTQEVGGGFGHYGLQNDTVLFFGLGGCGAVQSVEVRWPDAAGTIEAFENVKAGRVIELRMGDPEVHEVVVKP